MNEYERRLAEIRKRPRTLPTKLRPEHEAFLSALTISTLKFLNRLYLKLDGQQVDEATSKELAREVLQLNDLDKAGLLSEFWWQEYEPGRVKPTVD